VRTTGSRRRDPFQNEVRDYLERYLDDDNITPASLERLMARLTAITLRERGTSTAARLIEHGVKSIEERVFGKRRR
jgi:hypothetical protein